MAQNSISYGALKCRFYPGRHKGSRRAWPEEQGPMILPKHDPEDIISPQTSTIVAEPPSQMREEDKEETMVLVEEVPIEHVFTDGSLCDYQVSIYVVLLNAY